MFLRCSRLKHCLEDGWAVGHLLREVSQICKFLLDHGTSITADLTLTNYRRPTGKSWTGNSLQN